MKKIKLLAKTHQLQSLSKIGLNYQEVEIVRLWVTEKLNKFLNTSDTDNLNFVENTDLINQQIREVLKDEQKRKFFRGKLNSIRKNLMKGVDLAGVFGEKVNFEVFPTGSLIRKSEEKSIEPKKQKEHPNKFPRKFWTMKALQEWGAKYKIRSSAERKDKTEPYSLFIVPEYKCVIAVADEYGKATYFLPLKNWQKFAKSTKISDLRPDERVQWLLMPRNIGEEEWENIMGDKLLKIQEMAKKLDEKKPNISQNFENAEEEKAYYKKCLKAEVPRLIKEAGLIEYKGKYIFSNVSTTDKWGDVTVLGKKKKIRSFPNSKYLKSAGILSNKSMMTKRNQLKKLFENLDHKTASESEVIDYYKSCLDEKIPDLIERVGLFYHEIKTKDGNNKKVLVCSKMKGFLKWGKLIVFGKSKNLTAFPNSEFLRNKKIIGESSDQMMNRGQFEKLLIELEYSIMTIDDFNSLNKTKKLTRKERLNQKADKLIDFLKERKRLPRTVSKKASEMTLEEKNERDLVAFFRNHKDNKNISEVKRERMKQLWSKYAKKMEYSKWSTYSAVEKFKEAICLFEAGRGDEVNSIMFNFLSKNKKNKDIPKEIREKITFVKNAYFLEKDISRIQEVVDFIESNKRIPNKNNKWEAKLIARYFKNKNNSKIPKELREKMIMLWEKYKKSP